MKNLISLIFLAILLPNSAIFSQEVSTLITDSDKRFEALHWHEDGRIYAIDYINGSLYQLYLDGTAETILSGFPALAGGGFDSAGNFYVSGANTGEIFRVNPDNTYVSVANGFLQPISIIEDSEDPDLFYVTEYQESKVTKLSMSTGTLTPFVSDQGINGPDGIIYDWNGDLLVSNWENHKIHRIDEEGNISLFANLPAIGNMGYITIVDEFLYVPSVTDNKVFRVSMDGQATVLAGTGLIGNNDGETSQATFDDPNGICRNTAGDTLLVSSSNSVRIITNFSSPNTIDQQKLTSFNIYPNPVSDILKVDIDNSASSVSNWIITSDQGTKILDGTSIQLKDDETLKVDISELASGKYVFQLTHTDGKVFSQVFIKLEN